MNQEKPKILNTIGIILIIISALMLFSHSLGIIISFVIGLNDLMNGAITSNNKTGLEIGIKGLVWFFNHFIEICLFMIIFDILLMIGGINIRKYKYWAKQLVCILSIIFVTLIWIESVIILLILLNLGFLVFAIFSIINGIIWSSPIVLLIWTLNKKSINIHFE